MVLFDEGSLLGPDGVALVHTFGSVLVAEERGLVRDDQILVIRGSALQDVERCHHRYRDAGDRSIGIAGFESVYRLRHPRNADVILDGLCDFARGWRRGLRFSGGLGFRRGETQRGQSAYRYNRSEVDSEAVKFEHYIFLGRFIGQVADSSYGIVA